jgi:hypothetical protein
VPLLSIRCEPQLVRLNDQLTLRIIGTVEPYYQDVQMLLLELNAGIKGLNNFGLPISPHFGVVRKRRFDRKDVMTSEPAAEICTGR